MNQLLKIFDGNWGIPASFRGSKSLLVAGRLITDGRRLILVGARLHDESEARVLSEEELGGVGLSGVVWVWVVCCSVVFWGVLWCGALPRRIDRGVGLRPASNSRGVGLCPAGSFVGWGSAPSVRFL